MTRVFAADVLVCDTCGVRDPVDGEKERRLHLLPGPARRTTGPVMRTLPLAVAILAGLLGNALLGWWWLDPISALARLRPSPLRFHPVTSEQPTAAGWKPRLRP